MSEAYRREFEKLRLALAEGLVDHMEKGLGVYTQHGQREKLVEEIADALRGKISL